jgi:6-pyruvoyltetrahydropterin/6-carboxytetrahydropterin synthase
MPVTAEWRMIMKGVEFLSTKTYTHSLGYSVCFRQWKADSHCKFLHGYALQFKLTFGSSHLDKRGWVVDFGGLKPVKKWLDATFDHKLLVARDDPKFPDIRAMHITGIADVIEVENVGTEAFAWMVLDQVERYMELYNREYNTQAYILEVEVSEHGGNSAIARRPR